MNDIVALLACLENLPVGSLKQVTREGDIQTRIYQMILLHHEFTQPLSVVLIHKLHLKAQAQAHILLFSSDPDLPFDLLIDEHLVRSHHGWCRWMRKSGCRLR